MKSKLSSFLPFRIYAVVGLLLFMVSLACKMPTSSDTTGTQTALDVQSTQLALRETEIALDANNPTHDEPEEVAQAEPDYQATLDAQQATQIALENQATLQAQQLTLEAQNSESEEESQPEVPPSPTEIPHSNLPDFDTWMRSEASILLYEDMSGDFSVYRFIQRALDAMGVNYVDVRDALGNYKEQLLSGGPGGMGWDLIISGKELRSSVQGEFYVYLNDALNQGSSVIIEEWAIDAIGAGKLSSILSRCGVEFQKDWVDVPMDEQLLYPVNGTHPVHHYPNEGISLTNPSGYWNWTDQGDLIRLTPGSRAQLLWGTRTNQKDSYGTAVVCLDGQLIIQTYSSHSYGEDRIERMWQNYVYQTLMTRFEFLSRP